MTPYLIHIPKTGGSAIRSVLPTEHPRTSFCGMDTYHLPAWHPETINAVTAEHFVFAVIRDPLDRAVSLYHWLRNGHGIPDAMKYPASLASGCATAEMFWNRFPAARMRSWPHFWQQTWFIRGHVDYLLRFEFLDLDWQTVIKNCSVPLPENLPKLNATENRGAAELGRATERVSELYYRDFELHGSLSR